MATVEIPEIQSSALGDRLDCDSRLTDPFGHLKPQRVKVRVVFLRVPERFRGLVECRRQRVGSPGNRRKAVRSVIHAVHRGDVREQRLRSADVRRRLLAADVLFARLKSHPVREVAVRIDRHANDAARRLPDERFARRKECRMRSAVPHRHTESLRAADDNIGAQFAWRNRDRKGEQVGRRQRRARSVRASAR